MQFLLSVPCPNDFMIQSKVMAFFYNNPKFQKYPNANKARGIAKAITYSGEKKKKKEEGRVQYHKLTC